VTDIELDTTDTSLQLFGHTIVVEFYGHSWSAAQI